MEEDNRDNKIVEGEVIDGIEKRQVEHTMEEYFTFGL